MHRVYIFFFNLITFLIIRIYKKKHQKNKLSKTKNVLSPEFILTRIYLFCKNGYSNKKYQKNCTPNCENIFVSWSGVILPDFRFSAITSDLDLFTRSDRRFSDLRNDSCTLSTVPRLGGGPISVLGSDDVVVTHLVAALNIAEIRKKKKKKKLK